MENNQILQTQLKRLFQNYMKIAEIMAGNFYKQPKDACKMAKEFHKMFDKYGNRPRVLLKEIQRKHQIWVYFLYVNYLKNVRKEYLEIRNQIPNYPWTLIEDDMFNKLYTDLIPKECEKALIKFNLIHDTPTDPLQKKMLFDVENAVIDIEKQAISYLNSNNKLKRYSELIPTIRPQLYTELYDLRLELSDQRFQEEINKIKCVSGAQCKLTNDNSKPYLNFMVDSIPTLVANQIKEIVELIICQNEDFKINKDNHYGIQCGNRLNNIHKLVRDIIENSEPSSPLNFDDVLKQVLRTILIPKSKSMFGNKVSIKTTKTFKSIKSQLNRQRQINCQRRNSKFGNRSTEGYVFQRIIDLAILFVIIFAVSKYGNKFMREITELWMQGEEQRRLQLEDEKQKQETERQRRRMNESLEQQRIQEEEHQRRMMEFEASQRRFQDFERRISNQLGNDFNYESTPQTIYEGPNKMLEHFLEPPSETNQQTIRKKGIFKPSQGGKSKGIFRPSSRSSGNSIPVSDKFIKTLIDRFHEIQRENEILLSPLETITRVETMNEPVLQIPKSISKSHSRIINEIQAILKKDAKTIQWAFLLRYCGFEQDYMNRLLDGKITERETRKVKNKLVKCIKKLNKERQELIKTVKMLEKKYPRCKEPYVSDSDNIERLQRYLNDLTTCMKTDMSENTLQPKIRLEDLQNVKLHSGLTKNQLIEKYRRLSKKYISCREYVKTDKELNKMDVEQLIKAISILNECVEYQNAMRYSKSQLPERLNRRKQFGPGGMVEFGIKR